MPLQNLPGIEVIGKGYDAMGRFADSRSCKRKLFKFTGMEQQTVAPHQTSYKYPAIVDFTEVQADEIITIAGTHISEYRSSLNTTTKLSGGVGFFSGSLEVNFRTSTKQSSFNAYTTVMHEKRQWILRLPQPSILCRYLDPGFVEALNSKDAEEIFDTYGTHYIAAAIIGAKAQRHSTIDSRTVEDCSSLQIQAEASYASFAKLNTSTSHETSSKEFDKLATSHEVYVGGTNRNTYEEWKQTATQNPVFIGFPDQSSLRPIWDLIDDAQLKEYLKKSFEKYSYDRAITLPLIPKTHPQQISEIEVKMGSTSNVVPSMDFERIDVDLNRKAGGKYIYLCKKHARGCPLIDIKVLEGKNVSAPRGYEKINIDLNANAGGKYLYFCYSKATDSAKIQDPIIDIKIIATKDKSQQSPGSEWVKNPVDLNWGAGGDYIYMYLKKGTTQYTNPNKTRSISKLRRPAVSLAIPTPPAKTPAKASTAKPRKPLIKVPLTRRTTVSKTKHMTVKRRG